MTNDESSQKSYDCQPSEKILSKKHQVSENWFERDDRELKKSGNEFSDFERWDKSTDKIGNKSDTFIIKKW